MKQLRESSENNVRETAVQSPEEGGGFAPVTSAEIPLQSMMKTIVKLIVTLQPMEDHGGEDVYPTAHGGPHVREGG